MLKVELHFSPYVDDSEISSLVFLLGLSILRGVAEKVRRWFFWPIDFAFLCVVSAFVCVVFVVIVALADAVAVV